jgi:MerR family transcriptional regulator, copper efflux regulator
MLGAMPVTQANPAAASPAVLTTARLCEAAGVTRAGLRLYEREGLLPEPRRTASGYRQFGEEALTQLQAIRHLKELGFTLREIGWLLSERAQVGIEPGRLQELAQEQLRAVDLRIARLQVVRSYLEMAASGQLEQLNDPECAFLMNFLRAGNTSSVRAAYSAPEKV